MTLRPALAAAGTVAAVALTATPAQAATITMPTSRPTCVLGQAGTLLTVEHEGTGTDTLVVSGVRPRVTKTVTGSGTTTIPVRLEPGVHMLTVDSSDGWDPKVTVAVPVCDGWASVDAYTNDIPRDSGTLSTTPRTTPAGAVAHDGPRGSLYLRPGAAGHLVLDPARAKYRALWEDRGVLGAATASTYDLPTRAGTYTEFVGGRIYTWSRGAFEIHGEIARKYQALNLEHSFLGLPTSDEFAVPGGRRSTFEGGSITWTPAGGAVARRW
ncbi:hypothetical protein [Kineococcus glutinatus]|uniref:LGFP repeat-containing protein n=1 Tax=Kineococcus glutinatus TaxID=1070872 RepID=A0ABP9HYB8_9ACTN